MSPGLASAGTVTLISPVSGSTFTPAGALSPGANFVPSGAVVSLPSLSLMVGAGTVASSPGLPEPSLYSGAKDSLSFTAGASGSETVTVTSTVSLEPSGYVTTTGTVILSPGLAPSGTLTLMEPSSLTVTPSGAPSPGANFVPSGAVVELPSLSVNFGASTLASSPGLPEPSLYSGAKDSLSFTTVGSARNESARRSVPVGLPEASAANT